MCRNLSGKLTDVMTACTVSSASQVICGAPTTIAGIKETRFLPVFVLSLLELSLHIDQYLFQSLIFVLYRCRSNRNGHCRRRHQ